ncbi:Proteasome subunit alpha type-6 [Sorochytrium milnesiophthora]
MFRNQYDSDISTFSPQGRLHQIEYALEAVKQGSAAVGVKSESHVVLLALKRQGGELASYQKKLIKIDNHMGVAIAGLTSDARVLSTYMRNECMRHKMVFARPVPTQRVVHSVSDKAQINTQRYGSRPYGVGLLVAGYDETGTHLYECSPSGNAFEYVAQSIGSRSQSARTYLEKKFEDFAGSGLDDLIQHGLLALRDTLQTDKELNVQNVSIAVVGRDVDFQIWEGDHIQQYIDRLTQEGGQPPASDVAPMETE